MINQANPILDSRATRRITGSIFAAQSFNSAAFIIMFTVTPILAAQLGGTDSAAGVPATVLMFGRALVAYPIGWLMDKVGRRLGLSLGYIFVVLGAATGATAVITGSFALLLVSAGLLGMGRGATEQSRFAAAEIQPEGRRAKAIGLVIFAGTLGAIGGPLIVAPSEQFALKLELPGFTGPWLFAVILASIALLITFVLLRPDPRDIGRKLAESTQQITGALVELERPLWSIFAKPYVILAVAAMVVGQLVMTMLMVITPLHMAHNDYGTPAISGVIMAHTLGMFGLSGVTGWLIERLGRVQMIVAGTFVLVMAALLAPPSVALPVVGLSLFLLGLGWNFCHIAGSSLLADALRAPERGRAQGTSEIFISFAAGIGSVSTGVIFAWSGIVAVSSVSLGLALLLLPLAGWAVGAGRRLALAGGGD